MHRNTIPHPIRRPPFWARAVAIAACLNFLAGCAEDAPDNLLMTVQGQFFGNDKTFTRNDIDRIPYATLVANIGSGPQSILVLGRFDRDRLHWISADRIAFVTRYGRVVESAGLPEDRSTTRWLKTADPLTISQDLLPDRSEVEYLVDFPEMNRYSIAVKCDFTRDGREQINILGVAHDTIRWRETCDVPTVDWEFDNLFWRDAETGYVWQSEQNIAPEIPPMFIQVGKTPE